MLKRFRNGGSGSVSVRVYAAAASRFGEPLEAQSVGV